MHEVSCNTLYCIRRHQAFALAHVRPVMFSVFIAGPLPLDPREFTATTHCVINRDNRPRLIAVHKKVLQHDMI